MVPHPLRVCYLTRRLLYDYFASAYYIDACGEALGSVGSFHSLANLYTGDGVNVNFGIVVDDDTACNACGEAAAGQFDEGIAGFGSFNVVDVTAVTGDVTVGTGGRLDVDYTAIDKESGKERLYLRKYSPPEKYAGRISLYNMDPYDFERLIAEYFIKRGYLSAETIGGAGDRGVDVLATNAEGKYEFIQCKRYRKGSNIGSTPIQRVDSMRISRRAEKAWVITTSDFTPEGIDEARITGVNLVNGEELIQSLELYYPSKYCL